MGYTIILPSEEVTFLKCDKYWFPVICKHKYSDIWRWMAAISTYKLKGRVIFMTIPITIIVKPNNFMFNKGVDYTYINLSLLSIHQIVP